MGAVAASVVARTYLDAAGSSWMHVIATVAGHCQTSRVDRAQQSGEAVS